MLVRCLSNLLPVPEHAAKYIFQSLTLRLGHVTNSCQGIMRKWCASSELSMEGACAPEWLHWTEGRLPFQAKIMLEEVWSPWPSKPQTPWDAPQDGLLGSPHTLVLFTTLRKKPYILPEHHLTCHVHRLRSLSWVLILSLISHITWESEWSHSYLISFL